MILIILGFLSGFSSFFLGLHYSHIKIENKKEYKRYYKSILILRYLSIIFFVTGIGFIIINGI